jgi:hypothetical protein
MVGQRIARAFLLLFSLSLSSIFSINLQWGCLRFGALIPKQDEKKRQCLRLQNLDVRGTSIVVTVLIFKTIQFGEQQHRIEVV